MLFLSLINLFNDLIAVFSNFIYDILAAGDLSEITVVMALQLVSKEKGRKITKFVNFCDFFTAIFIRAIIATRSGLHAIYELE